MQLPTQRFERAVVEVVMVVLTAAFSMEADLAAAGSRLLRSNLVESLVEINLRRMVWVSEVLLLPAVLPDSAVLLTP